MENLKDIALELIPEVDDIMDYQPVGQQLVVWPYKIEASVTKSGIILSGSPDTDIVRGGLLQRGKVVSTGKRCTEVEPDMIVFYYNSAWKNSSTGGALRQGEEMYVLMEEFSIKGYVKSSAKEKKTTKAKTKEAVQA